MDGLGALTEEERQALVPDLQGAERMVVYFPYMSTHACVRFRTSCTRRWLPKVLCVFKCVLDIAITGYELFVKVRGYGVRK